MNRAQDSFSTPQRWYLALLFGVPVLLMIARASALPSSEFLGRWLSLTYLAAPIADRVQYVLFVPLGAVLVVFFRLTLGIRLLGPFRSILMAVAFQMTGIVAGLIFLTAIIGIMVGFRPVITALRLPYFARVSIMLSAVSLLMVAAIFLCEWLGTRLLEGVTYLPIVVICLTAEGFARALIKEGFSSALWRGCMTAAAAVIITLTSSIAILARLLLQYPELLLTQVGLIMVIAQYCDWRLLEKLNPPPKRRNRTQRTKSVSKSAVDSARPEPWEEAEESTQHH